MTSAPGTIEGACVRCLKTFFSHQNTSAKISSKKRPKNRPARCLIFDVDEPQSGKWRHLHRGRISCSQPKGDASNNLRPRANRGTAKLKSHNSFLKENDQNILFEAKVLFTKFEFSAFVLTIWWGMCYCKHWSIVVGQSAPGFESSRGDFLGYFKNTTFK